MSIPGRQPKPQSMQGSRTIGNENLPTEGAGVGETVLEQVERNMLTENEVLELLEETKRCRTIKNNDYDGEDMAVEYDQQRGGDGRNIA